MPKLDRGQGREGRGKPTQAGQQSSNRRGVSSFEARFGRVILEHGIAAIPAGLFHFQRMMGLDAKHLWFIAYILSCKWDADLPYPSLNKMERCTGVDIQALYRYKKALIGQGYLTVQKRLTERGGYDTDAYDFSGLFDSLEECIAAEQPSPNRIQADGPSPAPADGIESDSSFVARYGRVIVRYGVAAIPKAIFTYQKALRLTPQQVWFVGYILSFKWDAALPYPSIEKMALATGYNRTYLHEIKRSLVETGYLHLVHRANEQGGQDTNAYDFSGLLDAIKLQLKADKDAQEIDESTETMAATVVPVEPPARLRSRNAAQKRASTHANGHMEAGTTEATPIGIIQDTPPGITGRTRVGITEPTGVTINGYTGVGIGRHTRAAISGQTGAGVTQSTESVQQVKPTHRSTGKQGQVSHGRHEIEAIKTETLNRFDSNQRPQIKRRKDASLPAHEAEEQTLYSPYIAAVISDFSAELGDQNHIVSNVTQALRIYSKSGMDEEEFAALLFTARKLVRTYQGKQGMKGIENKMSYFFAILRSELA
ncbi:MAG: hypothetical protein ABI670_21975 [Chloroflexota bacterium]